MIVGSNKISVLGISEYLVIEGNNILDSGRSKNTTYKCISQPYGIEIFSSNTIVKNNKILESAYNGIRFYAENCIIENNYIQNFCLEFHDGGAIYTYNSRYNDSVGSGTIVKNNIIVGSSCVDPDWTVFGIYLDDMSHDVTVSNNTVTNTKIGVFLHNTKRHKIIENNLYNNFIWVLQ